MAELTEYQTKIKDLLTELAAYGSSDQEVESQLVFDTERNHYQLMHVGWRNKHRIYGCVVHLDIKDGKIWFNTMVLNSMLLSDLQRWVLASKIS
jgi:hypothetical protein